MAEPTTSQDTPGTTTGDARGSRSETQETLGQYILQEKLGEGGMGAVYKAIHSKLKKPFAVKILTPRRDLFSDMVQRFHQEMEAVGRLEHPNVVRATDAGEDSGRFFLVMDYFEGQDLAKVLAARGPLPMAEACGVVYQAARGLQYIADKGLVHRDIKPSNLLVTPEGQVKILDLGLALLQRQAGDDELTEAGQVMGTWDYMAPEQTRDSHQVDIRSDIYSLGCTFYKLLAGQPPFPGTTYPTTKEKARAHREAPVPPLSEHRQDVPEAVARVVTRMLAKKPEERFQWPREVADALEGFVEKLDFSSLWPAAPTRGSGLSGSTEKNEPLRDADAARRGTRPWFMPVLSVILGIGLAGLLVFAFLQMTGPFGERDKTDESAKEKVSKDADQTKKEIPPAKWEAGIWYPLMTKPPMRVHWPKDWTPPGWTPGREEILASAGSVGLLGLVEPKPGSKFAFRVAIRQNPFSGGTGIFFGYRKSVDGDNTTISFQAIGFVRTEDKTLWIERSKSDWRVLADGGGVNLAKSVGKMPVAIPPLNEDWLEIEMRGDFLSRVSWGTQDCSLLTDFHVNKSKAKLKTEDYRGILGVTNTSNLAHFREARFMYKE